MNAAGWVGIIVGFMGLLGAIAAYLGTRGKTQKDFKTSLDARIDARVERQLTSAWEKIDHQDLEIATLSAKVTEVSNTAQRQMSAFGRILRAIAAQWSNPHGPDLDPHDIAEIESIIPTSWLRRQGVE